MIIQTSKKQTKTTSSSLLGANSDPIIKTKTNQDDGKTKTTPICYYAGQVSTLPTIGSTYPGTTNIVEIGDIVMYSSDFYILTYAEDSSNIVWQQLDSKALDEIAQMNAQIASIVQKYALSNDVKVEISGIYEYLASNYYLKNETSSANEIALALSNSNNRIDEVNSKLSNYAKIAEVSSSREISLALDEVVKHDELESLVSSYGYALSSDVSSQLSVLEYSFNEFKNETIEINKQQSSSIALAHDAITANNAKLELVKQALDAITSSKVSSDIELSTKFLEVEQKISSTVTSSYVDNAKNEAISYTSSNYIPNSLSVEFALSSDLDAFAKKDFVENRISDAIESVCLSIDNIEDQIDDLESKILSNSTDINTALKAIASNTTSIGNLQTKVDSLCTANEVDVAFRQAKIEADRTYALSTDIRPTIESYGYVTSAEYSENKTIVQGEINQINAQIGVITSDMKNLPYAKLSDFAVVSSQFYVKSETSSAEQIANKINSVVANAADTYLTKSSASETYATLAETSSSAELAEELSAIKSKIAEAMTTSDVTALIDAYDFLRRSEASVISGYILNELSTKYVTDVVFRNNLSVLNTDITNLKCGVAHHHDQIEAIISALQNCMATKAYVSANYAALSDIYRKDELSTAEQISVEVVQIYKKIAELSAIDPEEFYKKSELSAVLKQYFDALNNHEKELDRLDERIDVLDERVDENHEEIDTLKELIKEIEGISAIIDVSDLKIALKKISSDYTTSAQVCAIVDAKLSGIGTGSGDFILSSDENYVTGSEYIKFSKFYDSDPTCLSDKFFLDNTTFLNIFRNTKRLLFYTSADADFDLNEADVNDVFNAVKSISEKLSVNDDYDPEVADVSATVDAIDNIISIGSETNVSLAKKLKAYDKEVNLIYWELENFNNKLANYYTSEEVDEKIDSLSVDICDGINTGKIGGNTYVSQTAYDVQMSQISYQLQQQQQQLSAQSARLQNVIIDLVGQLSVITDSNTIGALRNAVLCAVIELSAIM